MMTAMNSRQVFVSCRNDDGVVSGDTSATAPGHPRDTRLAIARRPQHLNTIIWRLSYRCLPVSGKLIKTTAKSMLTFVFKLESWVTSVRATAIPVLVRIRLARLRRRCRALSVLPASPTTSWQTVTLFPARGRDPGQNRVPLVPRPADRTTT